MNENSPLILVVDDQRSSRDELVRMLDELGYRSAAAEGGLEGLRLVRDLRPALVLLDVVMPAFDGFKIAAAIKSMPTFVPVMMLTGLNDLESKRRGQAAGADDFLSKPVALLELQIRIAAMLRIKSLTDALDLANRRLAELAETDSLTGVPNRRRVEQVLASEFERAQRYRRPLTTMMADIDHFKSINDTLGHAAGDEALKQVARELNLTLRQSDQLGRFGGEEFLIVAPEVGPTGAMALAERLRRRVEERVRAGGKIVTISIGVMAWDGTGDVQIAELVRVADQALYDAKRGGRNRVQLTVLRPGN